MTPAHTNRLIDTGSPYLLQHAHNPVNWYPWGEEAFAAAREQDKPIFLSIGYSTCHWCHVMERESFENEAIAEILNRQYISIKVDREERPDVDRIYMLFVQATTGSGGWPMSVFLTPELKPFFGGTYFPPENRYGRVGFPALLEHLAKAWNNDRSKILSSSEQAIAQLREHSKVDPGATVLDEQRISESTYFYCRRSFDKDLGGFGGAPKFPRPVTLQFLLRHYYLTKTEDSLEMVTKTLEEMARGGMNDQLGGGFHRYSVDAQWFVPHFEKMLYDQAQLAIAYLEAYQLTKQPEAAQTARDIFEYVLREMTHPEGGFFSAEDADSVIDPANPKEKGEGAFFVWTYEELENLLGEAMPNFVKRYGVERNGNVLEDPHHEFGGKNILYLSNPNTAPLTPEQRASLMAARSQRVRPGLDDKILTAWNGLMISAFALGGRVLEEPRYTAAAERAIAFIESKLLAPNGVLLRRFRQGESAIPGFLDDYAFFAQGLLDTYDATGKTQYIRLAARLAQDMCDLFEDSANGGFFSTADNDAHLVLRMKEDYDGAEPSGNSVAVNVLWKLGQLTGDEAALASAHRATRTFAARLAQQGPSMPLMICSLMALRATPRQVVLAGTDTQPLEEALNGQFLPFHTRIFLRNDEDRAFFAWSPALANMQPVDGQSAAYVCENFTCQLPVTNWTELVRLLH
jgi:uncharacterized protein